MLPGRVFVRNCTVRIVSFRASRRGFGERKFIEVVPSEGIAIKYPRRRIRTAGSMIRKLLTGAVYLETKKLSRSNVSYLSPYERSNWPKQPDFLPDRRTAIQAFLPPLSRNQKPDKPISNFPFPRVSFFSFLFSSPSSLLTSHDVTVIDFSRTESG